MWILKVSMQIQDSWYCMKTFFSRYSTVFADAISYCFLKLEDKEELFPKITVFQSVFRVDPSPLAEKRVAETDRSGIYALFLALVRGPHRGTWKLPATTRICYRKMLQKNSITKGSLMETEQIMWVVQVALCQFVSPCSSLLMRCQRLRWKGQEQTANYCFKHISFNIPSLFVFYLCLYILHYSPAILPHFWSQISMLFCAIKATAKSVVAAK